MIGVGGLVMMIIAAVLPVSVGPKTAIKMINHAICLIQENEMI